MSENRLPELPPLTFGGEPEIVLEVISTLYRQVKELGHEAQRARLELAEMTIEKDEWKVKAGQAEADIAASKSDSKY